MAIRGRLLGAAVTVAVAAATAVAAPATAQPVDLSKTRGGPEPVRFATFNASLNRDMEGDLLKDLRSGDSSQIEAVAEIIQRTRPDVLLLNEFDYVRDYEAVDAFRKQYLRVGQDGADPISYPHAFVAPSNTGIPSGYDLNNSGTVGGPDDAFGFGFYPGQYGMAVLSRFPIDRKDVRTFQEFLWADMPGARLPDDPTTPEAADWFSEEELEVVRLSSKSHWDVPIKIRGNTVHFLVSHPTPPVFDGLEDRNGLRNYDEIRFWADYITPGQDSAYIYDDDGGRGGLDEGEAFVIAGDQNSDPLDGDSVPGAIQQLTEHPLVVDPLPTSLGAVEAAEKQGGANVLHDNPARYDTADFADTAPGNLRADYVLPSSTELEVVDAGVFWPVLSDPLSELTGVYPFPSSDHRLVWVDVRVPVGPR